MPPQPTNRSSPTICCAPLNLQIDQLLPPAVPHPLNLQIDQLLPFAVPPATYKSISYSYLQFAPLQPTNRSAPPTCCAPPLNLQIDPLPSPPLTYKSIRSAVSHLNLQIDQLLPFAPPPTNRSSTYKIDQLLPPAVPHPLNLQLDQLLTFAVPPATYKSISYPPAVCPPPSTYK